MSDSDKVALKGRVALVTGGAQGLGRAIAAELIRHGASAVIVDHGGAIDGSAHNLELTRQCAAELGANAAAFPADITAPGTPPAAVDFAIKTFGALDIVVNNAAIIRDAFIFKSDPEVTDAVIRNNLTAAFNILSAATPIMRDQAKNGRGGGKWGRIINIVSTAGIYGNFGQSSYGAAKGGLIGLTRVVAMDMARAGVTCNAIAPFAATRVTESIKPANDEQARYKERALTVKPYHVGRFAAFLCSDAGAKITGQLFGVRSREVMLFSQPRPIARLARDRDWTIDDLAAAVEREMAPKFT
ncbi:MAG: SDR family NAD(P)-dependent oxidoreductase, partial [Candidatus Binataceae bacterium]